MAASCLTVFMALLLHIYQVHAQRPNIIFIMSDDQGFYDIGYHGSEIKTPILDDLAANGVKLENYYAQPLCAPSRYQLLTGRYQTHTGMHQFLEVKTLGGVPLNIKTIGNKLQESGYATHAIGKWHIGYYMKEYTPTFRGFDSFFGLYNYGFDYYEHVNYDEQKGIDLHHNLGETLTPIFNRTGEYATNLFSQHAIDIVEQHDTDQPLFLYLSFTSPHIPHQVPDSYLQMYEHITDINRRFHAAMITCMDDDIGSLVVSLKEKGLWDNTVLMFSSDNGGPVVDAVGDGASNFPLRGQKDSFFEGGIRVPAFVSGPLLSNPGTVSTELMHLTDWFPTMLHLAGASDDGLDLDGHNQWHSLDGGSPGPRTELLHQIDLLAPLFGDNLYPDVYDVRVRSGIRVGEYKLLTGNPGDDTTYPCPESAPCSGMSRADKCNELASNKNIWLFNIHDDPSESKDLVESHPDVVLRLLERLAFYNSTAVAPLVFDYDDNHSSDSTGGAWVPWVEAPK